MEHLEPGPDDPISKQEKRVRVVKGEGEDLMR